MREQNPDMDFQCDLLEDTKTFADDLYDHQIINIAKGYIQPHPVGRLLTNKHGRKLVFSTSAMYELKRYCKWLIEVGAVKVNVSNNNVLPSNGIAG